MDSSKTTQQQQKDTNQPHVLCKTEGSGLNKVTDKVKAAFQAHSANPGPVIHDDFKAQEEGTKEERMAKAREMNK